MDESLPEVAFDGGSPRTRKRILYRLKERLKNEPGVEYTRFEPGRIAPVHVIASVETMPFLEIEYPAPAATFDIRWSPRSSGKDHFRIQWYERKDEGSEIVDDAESVRSDGYTVSCGYHQDNHFNELGKAHFQEEYPDGTAKRYGVQFDKTHPVWILSSCLAEFPDRLEAFRGRLTKGE